MKGLCRSLLFAALLLCTMNRFAYAAAFQFYELGAPINGSAGVGQAVVADDASIAYYNPAAMTHLLNSQILIGGQSTLSYVNFSPSSSNTIVGNNGGSAGVLLPGADGYFVYNYSPRLKWGISLTTPYGGALNYNNDWVGRYIVQQMLLYTVNLNPSVAYQWNDWISLGAGFSIEYANLYQTVAIPISPTVDGQATLKVDNMAPGFNLGVLLTPRSTTKVGIAYRSQIVHDLHGNVSFMNITETPGATTKLVMPANVIASLSQDISNCFTLLGEVGWSNWSSMVNTIIHVDGLSAVNQENWHDTYRVGLGGQYQMTPNAILLAGASYDSSPTSSSRRLPDLPMDRQIRVGLGLKYALSMIAQLGISYEYMNLGNASINNTSSAGVLAGSYSRNYANFFQASLNVSC